MIKKERVRAVLRREPVDRLPVQVSYTKRMAEKLSVHFGCPVGELPSLFGNHLLRVDVSFHGPRLTGSTQPENTAPRTDTSPSADTRLPAADWWGVVFNDREEGYFVEVHPLKDLNEIDAFPWPDPEAPDLLDAAVAALNSEKTDTGDARFVIPNFGFALFERAWSLRGLEDFMMDLLTEESKAEALLEKITMIQVRLAKRFVGLGAPGAGGCVDGGYFGDDLGAQKGLLFSPELFRKIFKPRYRRMFDVFKNAGLPVIMHSDGDIKEILPDLIEIGLDCLNPCQPEVMDHAWLKKEYGKDLAFFGGLSTQEVLPRAGREAILRAGGNCIRNLASDGTGLIYGPSHRIMSDIPMSSIEAYLETCARL